MSRKRQCHEMSSDCHMKGAERIPVKFLETEEN